MRAEKFGLSCGSQSEVQYERPGSLLSRRKLIESGSRVAVGHKAVKEGKEKKQRCQGDAWSQDAVSALDWPLYVCAAPAALDTPPAGLVFLLGPNFYFCNLGLE